MAYRERTLHHFHEKILKAIEAGSEEVPKPLQFFRVPDFLKVLRTAHCMTQRQLSERAGITQAQISRIEHGRETPTINTLERLYSALGARLLAAPVLDRSVRRTFELRAYDKARDKIRKSRSAQGASENEIDKMIREEQARILERISPAIWDD